MVDANKVILPKIAQEGVQYAKATYAIFALSVTLWSMENAYFSKREQFSGVWVTCRKTFVSFVSRAL